MRSIKYKDYENHKCLHDEMADEIIPAIEKELEETSYSEEVINHFLGICLWWLTGHIMIEDHAITGKPGEKNLRNINMGIGDGPVIAGSKATKEERKTIIDALEETLSLFMEKVFNLEVKIANKDYAGGNILGNLFIIVPVIKVKMVNE